MGVSISGLVSNMDTDAIVAALVSGYTVKKESYEKAQTKLEWKQEAWKELNTKINSFYKNQLSAMRFSSAFNKKTSTVSGTQATVTASNDAVTGTQKLKVKQLATSGYLTGGVVKKTGDAISKVSGSTKMKDLGITDDSKISLKVNGKSTTITLNENTTVDNFVSQLKSAGLNASFDANNQRFFISSKTSGADGDFQLMAGNDGGSTALSALGLAVTTEKDMESYKEIAAWDLDAKVAEAYAKKMTATYVIDGSETGIATTKKLVDGLKAENTAAIKEIDSLMGDVETKYSAMTDDEKLAYKNTVETQITDLNAKISELNTNIAALEEKTELTEEEKTQLETYKDELKANQKQLTSYEKQQTLIAKVEKNTTILDSVPEDFDMSQVTDPDNAFVQYVDGLNAKINESNAALETQLRTEYSDKISEAQEYVDAYNTVNDENVSVDSEEYKNAAALLGMDSSTTGPTRIAGQNAVIELNGATFESNTNTFQINGLTITANAETVKKDAAGNIISDEEVTITTDTDTQGIYDMIKDFFKEYNTLINEMDKLYNADSSKGYEPLTDDEKEAMSEDEIEKWEKKIKDSLLRRDSTLDSVSNAMKMAMQTTIQIDGKNYNLSSFGIKTLSYFTSADNEKAAYHIDGDKDDSNTSGNTDKLMAAIGTNPEVVAEYFNKLTNNVYMTLGKKMQSSSLSSAFTVYNDKQMKTEYNEYSKLIEKWEDKIESYETRYRKQFSAMESALASLNAQQTQLSGFFS